jgi:acyl-coenzyme A thioesterase PaaI-like protein
MRYSEGVTRPLVSRLLGRLPETTRANLVLRTFSLTKIPLLAWTGARVVAVDDRHCVVRIPLRRRTRNHLGSMYFGVLMVGADLAGGLLALRSIMACDRRVSFAFKDVAGEFLKRAESDTFFACRDGEAIAEAVAETVRTGERVSQAVAVTATTPETLGDEPVATFRLTLSVKAA